MKGCQDVVENTLLHFLFWCMQMVQTKESLKCCGFQSMEFVRADCQSHPPEDCGEVLESQWPEEFVNPNLDTLHTHLTFSIHLKWTALRNDTLYEADPCKITINKVCANKHNKYLLC